VNTGAAAHSERMALGKPQTHGLMLFGTTEILIIPNAFDPMRPYFESYVGDQPPDRMVWVAALETGE
jgi:hypothetical protein